MATEGWEGRKGSVSLATSPDSLASPQIPLKPTGLRVRDLPQGHSGSWGGEVPGCSDVAFVASVLSRPG